MTEMKPTCIFLGNNPNGAPVQINRCQKQWDDLQPTGDEGVRFCDDCHHAVHQVVDIDGFQHAVAQGQCVMVSAWADPVEAEIMFVGKAGAASFAIDAAKRSTDAD